MTVSELITQLDDVLDLNVVSRLDVSACTKEQAMEQDRACRSILACCNAVLGELYAKCASGVRATVVEACDGFIDTGMFKIGKVLSLKDSMGTDVPYSYAQNGLTVKRNGKFNLCYLRASEPLSFAGEIVLPDCRISGSVFLSGVAAEYLRIEGDYSRSESWANKYLASLELALADKSRLRLPSRRWLT